MSVATVFAVQSGDSVTLLGQPQPGQKPPTKPFTLANISAPRFTTRGSSEPYGFLSREFLRTFLIGKSVKFSIYSTAPSGRAFGDLITPSIPSVALHVVKNGWAKVKELPPNQQPSESYSELLEAQSHAQQHNLGLWASDESKVLVVKEEEELITDPTPQPITKHITSTAQKCLVDHVITGSFIRIIITDRRPMLCISVSLAGIQCPGFRKNEEGQSVPDPFAEQAKFFVESRLLHREVPIEIHQFDDKRNCWVGSIRAEQGDLQCLLLKSGLAKLNEHHLLFTPTTAPSLREAEQSAKHGRLNIWADFVPPQNFVKKSSSASGKIIEVFSGDCLTVRTSSVDRRVFLASVRAPRVGTKTRRPDSLSFESREFLRKRYIGQTVDVSLCYAVEDREYVDVLFNGHSIAVDLVQEGLASVVKTKNTEERSRYIDELLAVENAAQKEKKGVFMPVDQQPRFLYQDLTFSAPTQKSGVSAPSDVRGTLSLLQRMDKVPAIVEKVLNGGRFKLLVPKASCLISMNLAGVSPISKEPETINSKAIAVAVDELLNRDVTIKVITADKRGSFIGHLFIGDVNWSLKLLAEGLAAVFVTKDLDNAFIRKSQEAEDKARKERVGRWRAGVLKEEVVELQSETIGDEFELFLGSIVSPVEFYASKEQLSEKANKTIVQTVLESTPLTSPPKKGAYVLLHSVENDVWYRAKVVSVAAGVVDAFLIDTGFTQKVPIKRVVAMPNSLLPSVEPVLAKKFRLSYVAPPPESEVLYYEDGMTMFERFANESEDLVFAKITSIDADGVPRVFLTNSAGNSINLDLVFDGLVIPSRKGDDSSLFDKFRQAANRAIDRHLGLFRYGDVYDPESDDF
ncbi:hypothetical protein GEMRC1_006627 [Eukaryota sp. GEM-RC1]